jgi:hypothetical protein
VGFYPQVVNATTVINTLSEYTALECVAQGKKLQNVKVETGKYNRLLTGIRNADSTRKDGCICGEECLFYIALQ